MHRTTINIDESLLKKVRILGSRNGWSLNKTISELLKQGILKQENKKKKNFVWITFRGEALPGIDMDDRDNLYGLMGERFDNH